MPNTDKLGTYVFLTLPSEFCLKYKTTTYMKRSILLLGVLAALSAGAQESRGICGNTAADQKLFEQRLIDNLEAVEAGHVHERDVQYVPVFFHLVGDASGNGRVREIKVLEQLCALNTAYEPMGIQFYLSPHPTLGLFDKTINNANVYSNQNNTFLMNTKRHQNAINYFITDVAASGNTGPGIVLAYYSPLQDWIVSRRDQINGLANNSTIPHETGHFFSLMHPFLGWESSSGFGPGSTGWPVAPVIAPDGVATERQDGTNCATAADRICDTGPDYKFAFLQAGCNTYNGGAKDPLGVVVDPLENNTMSYFDGCSSYSFTPLQAAAMQADLNSAARNYLDNSFSPASVSFTTPTDLLVSPVSGSTVQFFNAVQLAWNAVDGATHYLVEVDIIPTFATANVKTYITTGTSLALNDLVGSETYYWRVKPFNQYYTCAVPRSRNFKTPAAASAVADINGLQAWQVIPNPVEAGHAELRVNTANGLEANVYIVDMAGRMLRNLNNVTFAPGSATIELPVEGLTNGFYFVVLDDGKGRDTRKLVIAN
jgi:hypothetical protein